MELIEALRNPDHQQHNEFLDNFEDEIDPETFDIDAVNMRLK